MNNSTPTAQSGPSDRAIAQAFRELNTCGHHSYQECQAYNRVFNRAMEIESSPGILGQGSYGGLAFPHDAIFSATTPPAGARDAVTDQLVAECGEEYFYVKGMSWDQKSMRAAIEYALTGKADDGDADPGADEPQHAASVEQAIARLTDAVHDGAVKHAHFLEVNGMDVDYHRCIGAGLFSAANKGLFSLTPPATQPAAPGAVEGVWMFKDRAGRWNTFSNDMHRANTIASGDWDVRLFTESQANTAATGMGELPELPEPEGWTFQHEDTGCMTTLENDGINNPENFQKNNHRLLLCDSLYSEKQMRDYAIAALAAQPAPVEVRCEHGVLTSICQLCTPYMIYQAQPAPVVGKEKNDG